MLTQVSTLPVTFLWLRIYVCGTIVYAYLQSTLPVWVYRLHFTFYCYFFMQVYNLHLGVFGLHWGSFGYAIYIWVCSFHSGYIWVCSFHLSTLFTHLVIWVYYLHVGMLVVYTLGMISYVMWRFVLFVFIFQLHLPYKTRNG